MFDNQITVVGNLVADPRVSFTKDGAAVASFRIASTPRRFDRTTGEWRDGDTLYANVTCWRGLAENVNLSLRKGQSVVVIGRLSVRPYLTKEGEKRQSVDIDAVAVGPDLTRAVTVVKRAERGVVDGRAAAEHGAPTSVSGEEFAAGDPVGEELLDEIAGELDDAMAGGDATMADDASVSGDAGVADGDAGEGELVGAGAGAGRFKGRFGIG